MFKTSFLILIFFYSNLFGQLNNKLDESIFYMLDFISTSEYSELKTEYNDIEIADIIYLKMLNYHKNDISETLLALTFLFMPFKEMNINIPLINTSYNAVLIYESDQNFNKKNSLLPSKIFIDTKFNQKDIDKLAHFYGNAFITYNFNHFEISKIMGIFVELFEESFKLQGSIDKRDLYANELGSFFGNALNANKELLPSEVFWLYNYRFYRIKY